ncbi:type IV toxin-antitoxin system AbiEi family antitoxin [Longimicrobium terrae]|uniref:Uncharacterized protein n=1 Tax=Longimicrobium terrae TaxID=1639882 RepID=A0A841GYD6_9BACT|nr:type IV toxin-antitoxin system AbiEi family antitoxin [Longimicrobium terrae]MBB4636358.1 hypothetical protein [Longimicrobium terrae]MBB6070754.1 hypothetical protein [Longimicrobium terrae]NNC29733.1 hypothetical protein [Longimicrobium terrae]
MKQALSPECRVISRETAADGHNGEIYRGEDESPIHLRLRRWSAEAAPSDDPETVWVLSSGRPATLRMLREQRQNFVALTGAARLVNRWLYLDRTDLEPAERSPSIPKRFQPFADRNSLVVRTLLAHPGRTWGVRELAQESEVALGTASGVVRALAETGALRAEPSGRKLEVRVDDPRPLLKRWFAAYSWERNERAAYHAPMGDPERFIQRLPKLLDGQQWALTMQAGASRVAPHAAWDRVHIYVAVDQAADLRIGSDLGWQPALDGRVVLMRPWYRDSVWHGLQMRNKIPVVSTVQLLVDLWHYPLRGREQAEHLLDAVPLTA